MEFALHVVKNGGDFRDFSDISENQAVAQLRESNTVLNSGFYAMDSGFQVPSGWIPVFEFGF